MAERGKPDALPRDLRTDWQTGSFENVGNSYHIGVDPEQGTPGPLRAVVYGHKEWPKELGSTAHRRGATRWLDPTALAGHPTHSS